MDTWLLELRLKSGSLEKDKAEEIIKNVSDLIKNYLCSDCNLMYKSFNVGFLALFTSKSGISVLVRGFEYDGVLLTLDISTPGVTNGAFKAKVSKFEKNIRLLSFVEPPRTRYFPSLPSLKRGRPFSTYDCEDGWLFEFDFDSVVFDEVSPYQHIRIMNSKQYGKCLFLDNNLNLSESDLEYTRAITGYDKEDYKDKTVLILGGGDGGILHYLRDRCPAMITMIDIDQIVIDAAKIHLQGICHDALDSLSGENYEIIISDCVVYLKKYASEKKKFDYVINDLTDIPIDVNQSEDQIAFSRQILSLSMQVLKNDGKYFSHGIALPSSVAVVEKQFQDLECRVKYTKQAVCVPSFFEFWMFYTVWKYI
uniref:spermine synthase-like n=1 Tax=Styela clava TaxID=7725 RepID=UPI00193A457D|nr:spermine synthase-like [Styela clava]